MEEIEFIKVGTNEFPASDYQKAIFNEIAYGAGNMVIKAAAGSAKTTTIENCLRFIPEGKSEIFLAFNVSTVEKLKSEIVGNSNVNIMTFHGLGNRILRENDVITEETVIDEFKYPRYIRQNIESLTSFGEIKSLGAATPIYISNITSLVNYARYYMKMRMKDIEEVAEKYGIVPVRDEINVVRSVLIWGKENISEIDHTDMIWLPNVMNLTTKRYLYDYIFIDEAQDTTIAHQKLVDKCFKRGCRFIAVGDTKQQINVWCGATEEAIQNYENRPNTKEMKLPISYRCPRKIVEKAKMYSPEITAKPDAEEGEIRWDVSPNLAKAGDMVLCRIVSKLVEQYLSYLRNNKKAFLKGSDIVKETYLNLIEGTDAKRIDLSCATKNGLIPQLYRLYFERIEDVQKKFNIDESEAMCHHEILDLYDSIEGIKVLSEGLSTVPELVDKIKTIFNGDDKDAILLSTVHKAKGMEANNVFILCPSLLPSRLARKQWEIQAEMNLVYVAITRAKKTLNYIHEDEKGFFKNFTSSKSMGDEIKHIKMKIGYTPKHVNQSAVSAYTLVENENVRNNEEISDMKKPNKKKGGLKFLNLE